jgi:hypothetical protein
LLVNGESNVHLHSICAHITCVNVRLILDQKQSI